MREIIVFALANGLSLFIGAICGTFLNVKQRVVAALMAFGSGVLICALTFGLMDEAFANGGFDAVIIGFLVGGLIYIGSDYLLHTFGGRKHKRKQLKYSSNEANGILITIGSMLDGIPESIALGIALFVNPQLGLLMLVAIIISNFPEGVSSAAGLRKEKFKRRQIIITWILASGLITAVTILSYLFLNNLSANNISIIQAIAAGGILAMLADSMIPEAYEDGGFAIGSLTVLGFLLAFLLSKI